MYKMMANTTTKDLRAIEAAIIDGIDRTAADDWEAWRRETVTDPRAESEEWHAPQFSRSREVIARAGWEWDFLGWRGLLKLVRVELANRNSRIYRQTKSSASAGMVRARKAAQERIAAGRADREAAERYRELAGRRQSPEVAEDYLARAVECDRLGNEKLRSRV